MEGYECKVDGGLIMQQWASSRKWGPSPDLEDLPNLTDPLIVHHRISDFHSNSRKRPPSLIWFISWHFVSSDPICCCARSRRSKSLVKISGDFIESGKLGWRKNWLEWRPSASARPNKNYSMIWLSLKWNWTDFVDKSLQLSRWANDRWHQSKKKMTQQEGKFHL